MTSPSDPEITSPTANVDVPALLAELASLKDGLVRMQQVQQEELERYRVELAGEREEHAERARSGELGREWQTLQGRIDLGETSLEAVVRGEDDSAQAEVVRGYARENVETAAAELDAELAVAERGPELGTELAPVDLSPAAVAAQESRTLAAEIREQVARLQALPVPRV